MTDGLLLLSFGGPEGPDDVLPFLERVTRGRGIPPERLREVGKHYDHFGGVSPINAQNRAFKAALEAALAERGDSMRVYFGNRNSPPFLDGTLRDVCADGVRRLFVYATSAYASDSGCRQYLENLRDALVGMEKAPELVKLRHFYDHPSFVEVQSEALRTALDTLPEAHRNTAAIIFTAHSVPMRQALGSPYEPQVREAARLVLAALGREGADVDLAWQSRSGPPQVPWLEPDIRDRMRTLALQGRGAVVVVPIGFVSDHMEVIWDLDHEAKAVAVELGLHFARASTVGDDARIVSLVLELVEERRSGARKRRLGLLPESGAGCVHRCCPGALDAPPA